MGTSETLTPAAARIISCGFTINKALLDYKIYSFYSYFCFNSKIVKIFFIKQNHTKGFVREQGFSSFFRLLFHTTGTFVRKTPPFSEARSNKSRTCIEQNPTKFQKNRQTPPKAIKISQNTSIVVKFSQK